MSSSATRSETARRPLSFGTIALKTLVAAFVATAGFVCFAICAWPQGRAWSGAIVFLGLFALPVTVPLYAGSYAFLDHRERAARGVGVFSFACLALPMSVLTLRPEIGGFFALGGWMGLLAGSAATWAKLRACADFPAGRDTP